MTDVVELERDLIGDIWTSSSLQENLHYLCDTCKGRCAHCRKEITVPRDQPPHDGGPFCSRECAEADTVHYCAGCDEPIEGKPFWVDGEPYCCEDCRFESEMDAADAFRESYDDGDYFQIDGVGFADPGGESALRAETPDNPRDRDCPTCGRKNVLTRIDRQRGYQCDICADIAEGRLQC